MSPYHHALSTLRCARQCRLSGDRAGAAARLEFAAWDRMFIVEDKIRAVGANTELLTLGARTLGIGEHDPGNEIND